MAIRWDTPAGPWLEDDTTGRFLPEAATHSLPARARAADLADLLGGVPARCRCAAVLPPGFRFCPGCGQAADAPAGTGPAWFGSGGDPCLPRHVPNEGATSLDLSALDARTRTQPDRTMPAPPHAHCVFWSASFGYPVVRLLAYAPATGTLQYWDPHARQWQLLLAADPSADIAFPHSEFAWLPAWQGARGEAGILPGRDALYRLHLDLAEETWHAQRVLDCAPASAPAALPHHVACIVEEGLWTGSRALGDPVLYPMALPVRGWLRPVVHAHRVCWLHGLGQLHWSPGAAPCWSPWPDGWTPVPALGRPTASRDGRLWQLGRDAQGYAFAGLCAPEPSLRRIDGARTGFAGLLFERGHAVKGDPWDEASVDDVSGAGDFVLPLLRCQRRGAGDAGGIVLRLPGHGGSAAQALAARAARATVEWTGRTERVLDTLARLARPEACSIFVHAGAMWLHHPDLPDLRGWELGDTA
jgi:hypothetical protein